MGLPTISYCNFLAETGVTVTAREESTIYPALNILLQNVTHIYRSIAKAVVLDGATKHFWIADAAWNSFTGNNAWTFLICPSTISTGSWKYIINKWGDAGQRAYAVLQSDANLIVLLSSDGTSTAATVTFSNVFAANRFDRDKLSINLTATRLVLYVNGFESGRVDNTTQSGSASKTGTIPDALFDGTTRLTIGATALGGSIFLGKLQYVACKAGAEENGSYFHPTVTSAYWNFDDSTGDDSSGNNRHLTPVSMVSGDYVDCTAYQWIGFNLPVTKNPTFVVLDRRHNLTSTATVRLLRTSWNTAYDSVAVTNVTAGKPVVM